MSTEYRPPNARYLNDGRNGFTDESGSSDKGISEAMKLSLDQERYRYAMYILTQKDRPIPSREERERFLEETSSTPLGPDEDPQFIQALQDGGMSVEDIDNQIAELQDRLGFVKAEHKEDLERLYDYHGALMRLEQQDMYLSWNEDDLEAEFPYQKKLYDMHTVPHPRQSQLPSTQHTAYTACLPTPSLQSFNDDMARTKHAYQTYTLLPIWKQIAALQEQRNKQTMSDSQRQQKAAEELQFQRELSQRKAREARLEEQARDREQSYRFPQTLEDFRRRPKEMQIRIARILASVYNDPDAMEEDTPADNQIHYALLQEGGWKLQDTKTLGSDWFLQPELRVEIRDRLREHNGSKTIDPRRRQVS